MIPLVMTPSQEDPLEFGLAHLQALLEQFGEAARKGDHQARNAIFDALTETIYEVDEIASKVQAVPDHDNSPKVSEIPGVPERA